MGDVHDILGETSRAGRSRTQSITRDTRIRKAAPSAPKSKKRKDAVQNSSGEEFDFTGVELTPAVKSSKAKGKSSKAKGKEKETTSEADGRSAKRRKLIPDLSFLEASPPHLVQPTSTASGFALPSADLLKCIHHFACNYYSERGQLLNSGATYSREKVERRLAKLAAQNKTRSQDGDSDQENASGKTKTFRSNEKHRDMYRMLDGSALLVLGMLLQEHVGRLLTPRVPEGWEQGLEGMEIDEVNNNPDDQGTSSDEDVHGGGDSDPDPDDPGISAQSGRVRFEPLLDEFDDEKGATDKEDDDKEDDMEKEEETDKDEDMDKEEDMDKDDDTD